MVKGDPEEIVLGITEEEYEKAGSKFMTYPFPAVDWPKHIGADLFLDIEVGMPSWDTPGKSLKFPVTIIEEGPDKDKEDKISVGVDVKGVWKLKEVHRNITGKDLPMKKGPDGKVHPAVVPTEYIGKKAIAHYQIQKGKKGGDKDAADTYYPKLIEILSVGQKPTVESLI